MVVRAIIRMVVVIMLVAFTFITPHVPVKRHTLRQHHVFGMIVPRGMRMRVIAVDMGVVIREMHMGGENVHRYRQATSQDQQ